MHCQEKKNKSNVKSKLNEETNNLFKKVETTCEAIGALEIIYFILIHKCLIEFEIQNF